MKKYIFLAITFCLICSSSTAISVKYTLNFDDAPSHYVTVNMVIKDINQSTMIVKVPVWIPGSYAVRDFSRNIESVYAYHNKTSMPIKKIRKNQWFLDTNGKNEILITYRYYANELTVRTSHVDMDHAFINPSNILMLVEGHLIANYTLHISPYKQWDKISTALTNLNNDQWSFIGNNYDELADSPIEVGSQQVLKFEVNNIPHEMAFFGNVKLPERKLIQDVKKIIGECNRIFGDNPCEKYVFITHLFPGGGGGIEHANSCVLADEYDTFDSATAYKSFLSLVAHEYFHLWNVKRLRPFPLGPFDYDNENYTELLWVAEGFTAYYDDLICYRTGFYNQEEYIKSLTGSIGTIWNSPGNAVQTLQESSMDAWIKYYKPNENTGNSTVSYYTKGSIVAFMLDLEIIKRTNGKYNLDQLMQHLYTKYYKTENRAYTYEDFLQAVNEMCGSDMSEFFNVNVFNTGSGPDIERMKQCGINFAVILDSATCYGHGIKTAKIGNALRVTSVVKYAQAYTAGLTIEDVLQKLNDNTIGHNLDSLYRNIPVGGAVKIDFIRRGQMHVIEFEKRLLPSYQIKLMPYTANRWVYDKWLSKTKE